jgi:hypothetical protein
MNVHFPTSGAVVDLAVTERELQHIELLYKNAYFRKRCAIAQVRLEHGLLTADEQDALLLEGEELKAELELWSKYK